MMRLLLCAWSYLLPFSSASNSLEHCQDDPLDDLAPVSLLQTSTSAEMANEMGLIADAENLGPWSDVLARVSASNDAHIGSDAEELGAWINASLASFVSGDNGTVLLFVHLHKCGGTSIESIMQKEYAHQGYLTPNLGPDKDARMRSALVKLADGPLEQLRGQLAQYRVFARHIPFGFHALVAPRSYVYVTMLRDPTKRLLSLYGYLRFQEYWPQNLSRLATFAEWVTYERLHGCADSKGPWYQATCVDNYMTRSLCGYYALTNPRPTEFPQFLCAKQNLNSFAFVGVVEQFESSICVMHEMLHWKMELPVPKLNPSYHPTNAFAALGHLIKWDEKLHSIALKRFQGHLLTFPQCS